MKKNISGITIIEVIVATVFFSIIFAGLFVSTNLISSFSKESNIKLKLMMLAKNGVEKLYTYKNYTYIKNPQDKWSKFLQELSSSGNNISSYYIYTGVLLKPISLSEDLVYDYRNWEGPLDDMGDIKKTFGGISYYRVLKIADFDVDFGSIFDCNIEDNYCDNLIIKKDLSHPYLSGTILDNSGLTLEFSTGTIFNTKSLFIVNLSGTGGVLESDITNQTGIINGSQIMYIDFSSTSTGFLENKKITLSGATFSGSFIYGDNLLVGDSIDRAIYNLKNGINTETNDFGAYIFYPNSCNLIKQFVFYNSLSDSKFSFPIDFTNNCSDILLSVDNKKITMSGAFINDNLNQNIAIKPNYNLKIDLGNSGTGINLFSGLKSPRTMTYGTFLGKKGYSSIYKIGVRVVRVDDQSGKILQDEVFEQYLVDL